MYEDRLEIHIRSIFLQGLLLSDLKKFARSNLLNTKNFFESFENWAEFKENFKITSLFKSAITG